MKMETPNLTDQNIEKIAELFPNCVTEGKDENGQLKKLVNFDMLKQMLSDSVTEGKEVYEFTWPGKKEAIIEANTPIRKTLRPCKEESKNWDTTENLYIEGDNLEVLKLLQESYLGKVKMIFIDPPYNTGHDFIYNDNFKSSETDYSLSSGEYREDGTQLFKNTNSNGRFHSDWCSMIYPRLLLSRNLLSEDGLIFIAIDDNEAANLKELCDEIFGMDNFIADITWEKRYTRSNNAKLCASLTDHILLYRKSQKLSKLRESRSEKNDSIYTNPDSDPRGPWTSVSYVNPATKEQRPNLCYTIENPITGKKVVHPTNAWKYEINTYKRHVAENKLYWGKNGENQYPRLKKFLSEMNGGIVPSNLWYYKDVGTTDAASKDLEKLLGRGIFDFPKPVELIKRMIDISTNNTDVIMDFFSGSGSTAQAVIEFNADKNSSRKFIMVQLPEQCDSQSQAQKAGYKTICEIGKERIRRAGEKIKAEHPEIKDLDIGFRVLKVDSSNMNDVYYAPDDYSQGLLDHFESNIKEGRSSLDLLFGCLLDWGLPLSLPYTSEEIDGFTVHNYNDGDLIACFDETISDSVIKEIAKREPLRAVFRDSSFESNPSKINVTEIFKMLSPDTTVKVI